MATDPLTYELSRENLWLRELLESVAQELERISAVDDYASHTDALLARSMRIRQRLWEGRRD